MRPGRVLLLAPSLRGVDGISAVAREAASVLRSAPGADVCAWGLHDPWPGDSSARGFGGSRLAFSWRGLLQPIRRSRFSCALCLHLHLAPVAAPMAVSGTRLFVYLHGIEAWEPLTSLRRAALGVPGVRFLANSSHTLQRFQRANPGLCGPGSATVCEPGIANAIAPDPLPADLEPGFVLAVGRMDEGYKGHDELLEVWPGLLCNHPEARLVIAGDGQHRARLESKARSLGLGPVVRFLGRVSEPQLEALYRGCAFFAMPSRGEGFGLVYAEAMRAGKACLAGPGGPAEVVQHEVTGLIVDPTQRSALEAALSRLCGDVATRERWGQAGRRRQQARFTREAFSTRLLGALGVGT